MGDISKLPAPSRTVETDRYWDAAREGKLLIKQCDTCHEPFHYPRALCPFCLSDSSWIEASGEGTIYSYTIVHLRDEAYVVAFVTLAEGPTMMTNIITSDPGSLSIGQRVHVTFAPTMGDDPVPVFVPAQ
jgi:uncharacterized OB-fold protein